MTNGLNLNTFVPPTPLAPPPTSNGGGLFDQLTTLGSFGSPGGGGGTGLAGLFQQGFSAFQGIQSEREARKAEQKAVERQFALEELRIRLESARPPDVAPRFPVALPDAEGVMRARLGTPVILAGAAAFALILVMLGRRR